VFISAVYGVLYRSVCVGLEVCAHLVVGVVCVVGVCGGCLRCWGLCAFVIKSLRRLWALSAVTQHLMLLMMGIFAQNISS